MANRPAFVVLRRAALGLLMVVAPAIVTGGAPTPDNRAIATRFADLFYRQKKVAEAFREYVAANYIQHNPGIADGREAALAALLPLFALPDHSFNVEHILIDGDLVAIHIRATSRMPTGTQVAAVVDLYRLDHGRIVEHWDVIQLVPSTTLNSHPMF